MLSDNDISRVISLGEVSLGDGGTTNISWNNGLYECYELTLCNGKLHSVNDAPAARYRIGSNAAINEWREYGILHRTNGPAVVGGGTRRWFNRGKCHRWDGPAISSFGESQYYVHGVPIPIEIHAGLNKNMSPAKLAMVLLKYS